MTSSFVREAKSALESIELDLKGFSLNQCDEFINQAFTEERSLEEMIRITLIVGAGKEKRQKYSDDMSKWILQALRNINYTEDHGSITSFECQGTFKYQHDTKKNLKYVHVFPRANSSAATATHSEGQTSEQPEEEETGDLNIPEGLKKYEWLCLVTDSSQFSQLSTKKLKTWLQKNRCKELFETYLQKLNDVEKKLSKMKALSDTENLIYGELNSMELNEKVSILKKEMKHLVSEKSLSSDELSLLFKKLELKLNDVTENAAKEKIQKRLDVLQDDLKKKEKSENEIESKGEFKNEKEIKFLLKQSFELQGLEEKAGKKGLWSSKLSGSEIKALKHKIEIDEKLRKLFKFEEKNVYFQTEKEFLKKKSKIINEVKNIFQGEEKQRQKVKAKNSTWNTISTNSKQKNIDFGKGMKRKPKTGKFDVFMS